MQPEIPILKELYMRMTDDSRVDIPFDNLEVRYEIILFAKQQINISFLVIILFQQAWIYNIH